MPHDAAPPGPGHNGATAGHLHSHPHGEEAAEDLAALAAQFVDGFVQARDKTSFLRLAGVPFERASDKGGGRMKLVDVALRTDWQVGTASPSFGSRELSYLPFPGEMVRERTNMAFVYVSLDERAEWDLRDFLAQQAAGPAAP